MRVWVGGCGYCGPAWPCGRVLYLLGGAGANVQEGGGSVEAAVVHQELHDGCKAIAVDGAGHAHAAAFAVAGLVLLRQVGRAVKQKATINCEGSGAAG